MALRIKRIGEIETPDGETIIGCILVGTKDDVKEAAKLWGEDVVLVPASDEMTREPEQGAA